MSATVSDWIPMASTYLLQALTSAAGLVALMTCGGACKDGIASRRIETVSDVLGCARAALGGSTLLSAVTSLSVTFEVTPDALNKVGRPSTTEVTLGLPDKFRIADHLRLGDNEAVLVEGFAGDRQFARSGNEARAEGAWSEGSFRARRSAFARWVLTLLLRETPGTPIEWPRNLMRDEKYFKVGVTGSDGFNMVIWLDNTNCLPTATIWERAPNVGDARLGRTSHNGRHLERRDLWEYRTFDDGIRLPTRIRFSTDGVTNSEWKVTSAQVNAPLPADLADPVGSTTAGAPTRKR